MPGCGGDGDAGAEKVQIGDLCFPLLLSGQTPSGQFSQQTILVTCEKKGGPLIWKVEDMCKAVDYLGKQECYDICREQFGMWMQRLDALGIRPFQDHYYPSFSSAMQQSLKNGLPIDEAVYTRRKES
jgi:hypothetical protein